MTRIATRITPLCVAALLAGAALAPSGALAAPRVRIGPRLITVTAAGARAVIARGAFRLSVLTGAGAPALRESANRRPAPLALGPVQDPFGSGLDRQRLPRLYAPLAFLVGTDRITQYAGGLWGGNLLAGTRSGIVYSARRVLHVTPVAGGVRLTVATDDPTGRRLLVTVRARGADAIDVSAVPRPARGVAEMSDAFASGPSEGFFGFGGRHNAVDQHGQAFSSWVDEENLDHYQGARGMYPNGNTGAYDPQAEFFSTRPYGFLLAQPQLARFALDVGGARSWSVTARAAQLHYVVAPGAAPRALSTLTRLSGRQPAPARWALGPMLDRLVKNVNETTADYESAVSSDLVNLRRYHLPLTAYRLEGWTFPGSTDNDGLALHSFVSAGFQASVFRSLRARHIHPLVYLRPWLIPGSAPVRAGLAVRTASGAPYYTTSTGGERIALLDFTNPAAVRYWQGLVARALRTGADGFMQDFGEEILLDMRFHDGQTGATMHNAYPILYDRATRVALTRWARAHHGARPFVFSRAGYSGLPGTAASEGGNFPGDETTDWSHASGLASLTSDMLGRAVDGQFGFGTDIGGYYDLTTPPTTAELFVRWAQWAALSPVFRLHGSGLHGTHTPWSFGPAVERQYAALSRLHLRAAPLIERLWRTADRTGMPVTRPLWLADPHDPRAWHQDQEWMLGPDVLVAPVVTQGARSRSVFLPPGRWREAFGHHRVLRGGRSVRVAAGLDVLPYFTRAGTRPL